MNPQDILLNILVTTNGVSSAREFQVLMNTVVRMNQQALDQMNAAQDRAAQQYQALLSRVSRQNIAEFEREAKARADSAWAAERQSEKAYEAEQRARTRALEAAQKAEERAWGKSADARASATEAAVRDAERYFQAQQRAQQRTEALTQRTAERQSRDSQREVETRARNIERLAVVQARGAERQERDAQRASDRQDREGQRTVDRRARDIERLAVIQARSAERQANVTQREAQRAADAQLREANRAADESRRLMERQALSFNQIFGADFFARIAADALESLFSGVKDGVADMTKFAARTEELQVALDALAKTNNISTVAMDKQVQSLRDANIATQTARQVLLEFINAGLPLEKVTPLSQVAKDLAVIAGVSGSEEFERLTHGIVTLNSRVLRTAGVYITAKQAEEEWAKANNRTINSLTEEEKHLATINKVIEYGGRAAGAYEASLGTAAKQLRQLERLHMDFSDAVGGKFVPIMYILVKVYTAFLTGFTQVPSAFMAATVAVTAFTIALIAMNTAQIASLPVIAQVIGSLQLMVQVMMRTASLAAGWGATMALMTVGWVALIVVVLAVVAALVAYSYKMNEVKRLTDEQTSAAARNHKELASLIGTTGDHTKAVTDTELAYKKLDIITRGRIEKIGDETVKTRELRSEMERLARASNFVVTAEGLSRVKDVLDAMSQVKEARDTITSLERKSGQNTAGQVFNDNPDPGDLIYLMFHSKQEYVDQAKQQIVQLGAAAESASRRAQEAFDNSAQSLIYMGVAMRQGNETVKDSINNILDLAQKHGVAKAEIDKVRDATFLFLDSQHQEAQSVKTLTQALEDQIDAYNSLTDAKVRAKTRGQIANDMVTELTELAVQQKYTPEQARAMVKEMAAGSEKVRGFIEDERRARIVREAVEQEIGKRKEGRQRHELSELEKLEKQYTKLTEQVQSYYNLSSRDFTIRFRVESLERVKRDFESILSFRQQMRLDLDEPLPYVLANPKDEAQRGEQAQQIAQLQALVEEYQRFKSVFDGVTKVAHETREAEDQLASTRVEVGLPVVGALTRAEIGYQKSLRDTRHEIQQTAADVILLTRQREEAERDAAQSTALAYLHVSQEFAKREKDLDESIRKHSVTLEALRDPVQLQALVNSTVNLNDVPRVPTELQQIAKHAASIEANVARIAVRVTGKDLTVEDQKPFNAADFLPKLMAFMAANNIHASVNVGQTGAHNKFRLDHRNAIDVGTDPGTREGQLLQQFLRSEGAPFRAISAADIARGVKATSPHHHIGDPSHKTTERIPVGAVTPGTGGDFGDQVGVWWQAWEAFKAGVVKGWDDMSKAEQEEAGDIVKVDSNLMRGLLDNEEARRIAVKTAQDERLSGEIKAYEETWANEGRLHNQLIAWEVDLRRYRAETAAQRERDARSVALQTQDSLDRLNRLDSGDPEELERTRARSDLEHVQSRLSMRDEIVKLDREIAAAGEDAALRESLAYRRAVNEIVQAHQDAAGRVVAAQVKMADSAVYHADLDQAKVAEYMAGQASLTDAVSNMKIGTMDAVFSTIDHGLERIASHAGPLQDLVNVIREFSMQLLKLALMPVFQRLFGMQGAPSSYSQAFGFGGGNGRTQGFGLPNFSFGGAPGGQASGASFGLPGFSFGGLGTGSAPLSANNYAALNQAFGNQAMRGGLGFAPTMTQQQAQVAQAAAALNMAGPAAGGAVGTAAAGSVAGSAGLLGSMTPAVAAMLPLIGMQLGGGMFNSSGVASGLGMGAGLLLGGAGGVALLGGAGAGIFAAGGALSALGPLAAFMTNPFTIGIAGAALVAAYFINRSAKRRKEETARTDILTKSKEEVQKLIDQAKGGRLSMEDGRAQFLAIRQNYLDQVGQLTDKKTRNIAIATVRELDYQWSNVLQPLLLRSDRANELERIIVPTFGVGGQKQGDGLAYLHHREVILTQEMQRQVGVDRLRQAVPNYTPPASGGGDSGGGFSEEALEAFREMFANIKMTNVMVAGDDAADDLISRGDPNTFYSKTKLVVAKDGGKFLSAAARGMK